MMGITVLKVTKVNMEKKWNLAQIFKLFVIFLGLSIIYHKLDGFGQQKFVLSFAKVKV